ncbi:SMP-30/gluconolactonase/LRE family protein [Vibrio sp. Of14-4]|uniref:SMP-30/gluconolactonase/LRE family protein n=1 Tax=Vibrio sp. Of14-4 TaxID=2724878 RepID=UPI001EF219B9|nr:SMP-30/gluconolactonase/LRE family protein [Vibrio sp. Of14-4]MCG7489566.1 SMP-30/gluconolactonase/LRE family protein [Vibrio sp. Of14-4]
MTKSIKIFKNIVSEGIKFPEGSRWHNGQLFFSDMDGHAVYRVKNENTIKLFDIPFPSGLGWLPTGEMLISSMMDNYKIYKWDGRELTLHCDLSSATEFFINDMVTHSNGDTYVGDIGFHWDTPENKKTGKIFKVDKYGNYCIVDDSVIFPNGSVIYDGYLYVAESFNGTVSRFKLKNNGMLANKEFFCQVDNLIPDGISLDKELGVWVADPFGLMGVVRINGNSEITHRIDLPNGYLAFDCVLGGEDMKNLYIMSSTRDRKHGRIDIARVETAGIRM